MEKQRLAVSPSIARILNMSYPILINNYNVILLKGSSLSSTQRVRVAKRVKFLLDKGKIQQSDIDRSMNIIKSVVNPDEKTS